MSADELLDKAERCRPYWGKSGGITISGGEPLLQIDFLLELLRKAKQRGINTCIDTAGQPFARKEPFFSKFEELCTLCDLFLVDIKHIDPDAHKSLTGAYNGNILDMLSYLSDINKPVWIRHVLVPGITDDDEALRKTRGFIETLQNVERVEVLPYHSMGKAKYEAIGLSYPMPELEMPDNVRMRALQASLQAVFPRVMLSSDLADAE